MEVKKWLKKVQESDVENGIVKYLTLNRWFVIKIPNDALYKMKVRHSVPGAPDLVCVSPKGAVVWIEVKKPGSKPRRNQPKVHEELRKRFQRVWVVDSFDVLLNFLNSDKLL